MIINDDAIHQIRTVLESSDSFLNSLAEGDGFDKAAFRRFIEKVEACRPTIASLPEDLRIICVGVLEIPMLMRNSTAIVAPADREQFKDAIVDVEELFCSLFSVQQDSL